MRHSPLLLGALLLALHSAGAQSLADRIAAAGDGRVSFSFAARPEVCGDGEGSISIGRSHVRSNGERRPCVHGPVRVRFTMRDGQVDQLESSVGATTPLDGRDLGTVSPGDAARWLLALAARGEGRAAARAITPAVLADGVVVWPTLLDIARDSSGQRRGVRTEAAFWLSRFAGAAIGGHPATLADDDADDRDDVKLHAVFVLSQLRNHEGIAPLLDVARTNANLAVRRRALFWLGQSGDPRALSLFESLLRG
ncbi:MAG TPA: HEAT repeat domain-containing protein [Gemmatimonadaceae bacterium]|nr:HEAT repeat domain-containing protein [Gemmatimonadaceae bacterium]